MGKLKADMLKTSNRVAAPDENVFVDGADKARVKEITAAFKEYNDAIEAKAAAEKRVNSAKKAMAALDPQLIQFFSETAISGLRTAGRMFYPSTKIFPVLGDNREEVVGAMFNNGMREYLTVIHPSLGSWVRELEEEQCEEQDLLPGSIGAQTKLPAFLESILGLEERTKIGYRKVSKKRGK